MARRGQAMVALTCGRVETGMGARGSGADFDLAGGATGESGTESGSIWGNGARCEVRDEAPEAAAAETCAAAGAEVDWIAAINASGESGSSRAAIPVGAGCGAIFAAGGRLGTNAGSSSERTESSEMRRVAS